MNRLYRYEPKESTGDQYTFKFYLFVYDIFDHIFVLIRVKSTVKEMDMEIRNKTGPGVAGYQAAILMGARWFAEIEPSVYVPLDRLISTTFVPRQLDRFQSVSSNSSNPIHPSNPSQPSNQPGHPHPSHPFPSHYIGLSVESIPI